MSANKDRRMQSAVSIEPYAYGKNKNMMRRNKKNEYKI